MLKFNRSMYDAESLILTQDKLLSLKAKWESIYNKIKHRLDLHPNKIYNTKIVLKNINDIIGFRQSRGKWE